MAEQRTRTPLFTGFEWTCEKIEQVTDASERIAQEELQLDYYPFRLEIISSEQMMDAYTSAGMPINYYHWSFGKQFIRLQEHYKRGHMGLAYEIVINSNPCIAYLMEENSMTMQALVIAHTALGHNAFMKNNYLFKQWTQADVILDYLAFARKYIAECEQRYGLEEVEAVLDACHALQCHGVDRYAHPKKSVRSRRRSSASGNARPSGSEISTCSGARFRKKGKNSGKRKSWTRRMRTSSIS